MSLTTQDLAPQMIRLFYSSGLLNESDWTGYGAQHQKHKPILSVLTQSVSLNTFRDLLNAEITLKSGPSVKPALHEGLTFTSVVHQDELLAMLKSHQPPLERLLAPLKRDGVLDGAGDERLAALQQSTPRLDAERLAEDGLLNASMVGQWLAKPRSEALQQAGLFLSLYILRFNELIPAQEMERTKGLVALGQLDEVRGWLAGTAGLPSRRLAELVESGLSFPDQSLDGVKLTPALMGRLPQSFVRRQMFVPVATSAQALEIVTADPFNLPIIALMRWLAGVWVHPRFAASQPIIDRINAYYQPEAAAGEARAARPSAPPPPSADGATAPRVREVEAVADNVSAVQIVSSIVENAITLHTTDIHIEPTKRGLLVRYRIDGNLQRIMTIPPNLAQVVTSRVKVLAEMDVTERRRPQDGHFELELENNHFDFRISTLPIVSGEKIVIRILEASRVKKGLDEIGLTPKQQQALEKMVRQPYGLILVTGPTGSGKTSTLYAAMQTINSEKRNLVTIEDPVEYQLDGINQVQVDPHIGLTFSEGLRSVLRQDPDVIMVGEIRDSDTARNAIRAAMTGHLVFSTLHTNTAVGAIDALVHLGVVPFMLAGSLIGVINQRLVRILCAHCRKGVTVNAAVAQQLGLAGASRKRIFEAVGCEECLGNGYQGRTGVFEVLRVSDTLRPLLASHHDAAALEKALREEKMMSLQEAGIEKVMQGITSAQEVAEKVMLDV